MSALVRTDPDDAVALYGPAADDPPASVLVKDPPPPAPDPAAWQAELVELLAGVEHVRWALAGRPAADAGHPLVQFAEGSLQACEGLARDTPFAPHTGEAQAEAVAKAGAAVSRLAGLKPAHPGGLLRSVFSAFGHDAGPLDSAALREALLAHHEALHAYFALFTDHFQSSKAARGWVDAATCFLTDYKAMIRGLQ